MEPETDGSDVSIAPRRRKTTLNGCSKKKKFIEEELLSASAARARGPEMHGLCVWLNDVLAPSYNEEDVRLLPDIATANLWVLRFVGAERGTERGSGFRLENTIAQAAKRTLGKVKPAKPLMTFADLVTLQYTTRDRKRNLHGRLEQALNRVLRGPVIPGGHSLQHCVWKDCVIGALQRQRDLLVDEVQQPLLQAVAAVSICQQIPSTVSQYDAAASDTWPEVAALGQPLFDHAGSAAPMEYDDSVFLGLDPLVNSSTSMPASVALPPQSLCQVPLRPIKIAVVGAGAAGSSMAVDAIVGQMVAQIGIGATQEISLCAVMTPELVVIPELMPVCFTQPSLPMPGTVCLYDYPSQSCGWFMPWAPIDDMDIIVLTFDKDLPVGLLTHAKCQSKKVVLARTQVDNKAPYESMADTLEQDQLALDTVPLGLLAEDERRVYCVSAKNVLIQNKLLQSLNPVAAENRYEWDAMLARIREVVRRVH